MKENGHLPLFDIRYTDGKRIGAMTLSERSQTLLDSGEHVTVIYHTPQLLRDELGNITGSFVLYKDDDQIRTNDLRQVTEFLQLQTAIDMSTRDA